MKRSARCNTCGATIRPTAKDMAVVSAVRKHYWRHHPEVMLRSRATKEWERATTKGRR